MRPGLASIRLCSPLMRWVLRLPENCPMFRSRRLQVTWNFRVKSKRR